MGKKKREKLNFIFHSCQISFFKTEELVVKLANYMMAFQNHADKNKESIIKSCSQQFSTVKTIWREINLLAVFPKYTQ